MVGAVDESAAEPADANRSLTNSGSRDGTPAQKHSILIGNDCNYTYRLRQVHNTFLSAVLECFVPDRSTVIADQTPSRIVVRARDASPRTARNTAPGKVDLSTRKEQ